MKKMLLIIVGVITITYIAGAFSTQKIYTEVQIDASAETVWRELVKFEKYPEWNPFVKKISGELSIGSNLEVTIQPPGGDPMDFKPVVLVANKNKELRWRGRVLLPKLFDGEHYFIIEEKPDGTVQFVHGENFSGILALLLFGSMEEKITNGFETMNKALKQRAESAQK